MKKNPINGTIKLKSSAVLLEVYRN